MSKSRKERRQGKRVISEPEKKKVEKSNGLKNIYEKKYKMLLIIPFILLVAALVQIGTQYAATGDFLNKGISLKGGVSLTVLAGTDADAAAIEQSLKSIYPENDINVRNRIVGGQSEGLFVEADLDMEDKETLDKFVDDIFVQLGEEKTDGTYSLEGIGSSLGSQFFKQTIIALLIAFVFMGIVVFFYFRTPVPSIAVILAAFSDIVITLSIVNLLGIKLSTAGIAAFLMLIGYSVDTDILLTTRLVKRKEGTIMSRVYSALKTGLTMNVTSMSAILIALVVTESPVIQQIMMILFIGLVVDMINTWIQNVGILRLYLEKKGVQ